MLYDLHLSVWPGPKAGRSRSKDAASKKAAADTNIGRKGTKEPCGGPTDEDVPPVIFGKEEEQTAPLEHVAAAKVHEGTKSIEG